jgi:hypothetical protein
VRKDPNSGGTEGDIALQTAMVEALSRDITAGADTVHQVELVRSQIESLTRVVTDAEVKRAGEALNQKLIELEMNLVDLRLTGQGQDGVRFGSKLIGKIGYLAGQVASSDFKPTDQQGEVQKLLNEELQKHLAQIDNLLSAELGAFNQLLRQKNIANVVTGTQQ